MQAISQILQQNPVPPQVIAELIKLFEMALNHPEHYADILQAAIRDGMLDPADVPKRPDPMFLVCMLVALYGLQDLAAHKQRFAQGGLSQVVPQPQPQQAGPSPAALVKAILPVVAEMFVPGLGNELVGVIGSTPPWSTIGGGQPGQPPQQPGQPPQQQSPFAALMSVQNEELPKPSEMVLQQMQRPEEEEPEGYAMGGGALTRFARGAGSGRDDTIDAKLSDGEYVFDAETTALLGDGSSEEGAKRLDAMRAAVRAHKGKALAKGKISPNAKSPLEYLKG
jgi:hypothetical protein